MEKMEQENIKKRKIEEDEEKAEKMGLLPHQRKLLNYMDRYKNLPILLGKKYSKPWDGDLTYINMLKDSSQ